MATISIVNLKKYWMLSNSQIKDMHVLLETILVYSNKVTDEELERAKRRVYVEILQHETQNDLTQALGNNLMYYGRRVTTKELS